MANYDIPALAHMSNCQTPQLHIIHADKCMCQQQFVETLAETNRNNAFQQPNGSKTLVCGGPNEIHLPYSSVGAVWRKHLATHIHLGFYLNSNHNTRYLPTFPVIHYSHLCPPYQCTTPTECIMKMFGYYNCPLFPPPPIH